MPRRWAARGVGFWIGSAMFDRPSRFGIDRRCAVRVDELGPNAIPIIGAQIPPAHAPLAFPLYRYRELGAAGPDAVHDVLQHAAGRSALLGELVALGRGEWGEESAKVHEPALHRLMFCLSTSGDVTTRVQCGHA
jgi:hypothetical protein